MEQDLNRKYYTPTEVGIRWKCSAKTVVRYCQAEALQHMKLGKVYRISIEAIEEFENNYSYPQTYNIIYRGKRIRNNKL